MHPAVPDDPDARRTAAARAGAAEALGGEIAYFQQQEEMIATAITKLREYRSALITNAVTGKIDVRGFTIPEHAKELAHA